ncbi:GNAT family N-acetyltransferase [Robertmurraya korlensis]|uniref:GNAT family N-acetyltransferase n=1 Tax=Robertmurraya korlensis TaxID=519977 RepID=UPI000823FFFA|nr:GNAT family N-acetyltransferase [Robertmurraya korlensis]
MAIRRANAVETDYILKVSGLVINESTMGYATNNIEYSYAMFLPVIQNGGYYLIEEESRMIKGWILLTNDWNPMTGQQIGHLVQLYVFPSFRKFGIGKRLMKAAIQNLQKEGINTIQLNVFSGNPAKNLYQALGFKKISTIMELQLEDSSKAD